ncbi:MAG: hypothetical protein JRG76_07215 [Deltaproteobacteria bacterium]|nr:hypothetical protein [Deltaproteobacteria bacterium]
MSRPFLHRAAARALAVCAVLVPAAAAHADAIMRTQAMFATTLAEIFVEDERVYAELEIGPPDLVAFRNLLPDELYDRLPAHQQEAGLGMQQRLTRFFSHDLVIATADGKPLEGRLIGLEPRERVRRDAVTGEPLPRADDTEPEIVLFARLEYAFRDRPDALILHGLRGPSPASVGFVVYHRRVPVNDFRYLAGGHRLELDWDDPWYSRFESRSMRRTYFAPMSGFLYVEPYEVRKEIIARPRTLQQWVDLGLEGRRTIPVAEQPEIKRRVAEFLRAHHRVEIDGEAVEPELARINFLERTLRTSRVIDPPEELDLDSAILGVIFVYPVDGLPDRVRMDWDLWTDRVPRIPAASVDQAGPLPTMLEPDFRVLEWQNFLTNPELPTLTVLAAPPGALGRAALWLRWLAVAGLVLSLALWTRRRGRGLGVACAVLACASGGVFWLAHDAGLSDARAREVVGGLLHNVYRAFDFRDDERIYDVLSTSVEGDLLEQIYLETRRGLELANQGGARARVKEVDLVELEASPSGGGGFRARTVWNVGGSVGHWGHMHQRRNRYRAEIDVASVDGSWKLVGLEILEEERL